MATPIPVNHASFSLDEVMAATGGRLMGPVGDDALSLAGVSTDTRTLSRGQLFVALSGDSFDGHDHLAAAAAAGATLALVEKAATAPAGLSLLRVASCLEALGALAHKHLERCKEAGARVVALTGSAGKTTTKEAIGALLRALDAGPVHVTAGNLNNLVGVPHMALAATREHRFIVLELGTNRPGEIARLARMVEPDVALLTLISAAHTEGLGGIDAVAKEKLAIYGVGARTAVGNADDERVRGGLSACNAAVKLGYGAGEAADYRIVQSELDAKSLSVDLRIRRPDGSELAIASPLLGPAGALAVAAAVAAVEAVTGEALSGVPSGALADCRPAARLQPLSFGEVVVLDDSYNSNPASCRASLDAASELATRRGCRLVAVLGEMRELGEQSAQAHHQIGRYASERAQVVVGIGAQATHLVTAVKGEAHFVADADQAAALVVDDIVQAGDVVLVKGSRGVKTERVVAALRARFGGGEGEAS